MTVDLIITIILAFVGVWFCPIAVVISAIIGYLTTPRIGMGCCVAIYVIAEIHEKRKRDREMEEA